MIYQEPIISAVKDICYNATTIKTIILYQDAQTACYLFFALGLILGLGLMYLKDRWED